MPNNRPHWADTAIAVFTGLMLLTYITGNWFSCQQLKLTRKAVEQAQRNDAKAIAAQQAIAQSALTSSQQSFDKSFAARDCPQRARHAAELILAHILTPHRGTVVRTSRRSGRTP